jgi:hypothetical protein
MSSISNGLKEEFNTKVISKNFNLESESKLSREKCSLRWEENIKKYLKCIEYESCSLV